MELFSPQKCGTREKNEHLSSSDLLMKYIDAPNSGHSELSWAELS